MCPGLVLLVVTARSAMNASSGTADAFGVSVIARIGRFAGFCKESKGRNSKREEARESKNSSCADVRSTDQKIWVWDLDAFE